MNRMLVWLLLAVWWGGVAPAMAEPTPGPSRDHDPAPNARGAGERPFAMWVWDVRHVTSAAARAKLLAFCQAERISTLYVMASQFTPSDLAAFRVFNQMAHGQAMAVHALAGDPRWALRRYHHLLLAWVNAVLAFNEASAATERFDGIHTDIEPYLLSRLWAEHPARLLGGFLDVHTAVAEVVSAHRPLQLGADVPFWYDDDPAYRILWHGRVQPPSHHLVDIADYITVMAYRNYAEGSDGVIALASGELRYAEEVGKSVVVGQETQAEISPAYITYGGSSPAYWRAEVAKVVAAFRARRSFGGIAVHHYESYRALVRGEA